MSETDTATNSRQIQNSLPFLIMAVWSFTHGEFHHFSSWQFYLLTTVSFTHHGAFGIKLNCNSCLAGFHWKFRLYAKTLNILLNLKAGGKLNSQQFKKLSQRAFFILSALFRGKGRLSPSCSWSKIPIVIFWPNAITPRPGMMMNKLIFCILFPLPLSSSSPPHFIFIFTPALYLYMCARGQWIRWCWKGTLAEQPAANVGTEILFSNWNQMQIQIASKSRYNWAQKSSFQIETKCKFKLQANPNIFEHRNPLLKWEQNANSNCKRIQIYLSTEIFF